ncbi:hypothetical protein LTR44_009424 [Exophiala sp. CCFEE 6388]|uniref:Zn(2)-C6 fungal-type domain-containing protein n=1 Tax=Exophiala sideris TaxID=1016849 RepID=A0ABR0JC32_9EURO|nr:hypothetical protein LTR69_006188 [Exophiala sideris]KAK5178118.1 hypothetical protein LTR44_009424 [Eurotiomycetes sp. CCFEE 6388]
MAIHTANHGNQAGGSASGSQHGRDGHRVHQACRLCAEKKLKCADEKPCKRCREKNIVCEFDDAGQGLVQEAQDVSTDTSTSNPLVPFSGTMAEPQDGRIRLSFEENSSSHEPEEFQRPFPSDLPPTLTQPTHDFSVYRQEPIARDILGDTLNFSPMGTDYGQYDNDPFLGDLDFSFLNDLDVSRLPSPVPVAVLSEPTLQQSTMSFGAEAYKHSSSLTDWNPSVEDNYDQEQQDLILAQNNVEPSPYYVGSPRGRAVPKKELFPTARDRILAMTLRLSSSTASNRIVASFPSLEILRDLIHHALIHMRERQIGNFIHVPSFDMNKQRPELLGALIAYGSVTSPSAAVRKFGYAFQETIRVTINHLVQEDYTTLRELGVAQAFYIQSYLGYYSGVNWKIEMAEANSMLGTTMLRRGKRLRIDQYRDPETFTSLPDVSADQGWLIWVEQESFKRLVYFAMTLDFHVGAARNLNALFSCNEISTPFPSSLRLWNAAKAVEWFDAMKQESALRIQQPLPLCKVMREPHLLVACKGLIDHKLAAIAYLAGCLSLVTEYWHTNGLVPVSQAMHDFVSKGRYSELSSMLEQFKAQCLDQSDYGPEVQTLQELVFLHLNVPFDEVARYCGSGSEDDAQASAPYVQRWYQSSQSRDAAWHAGQIFRAAKLFPPGALADIYVIALYHAGVVLWVWGLLCKVQPVTAGSSVPRAVIDGEETPEVSRFLKTGRSKPCLTDKAGVVFSLDDSAMVPELAKDIIATNWGQEPLPWTTDETFRFMTEFANVTRQRFGAGSA